jgi:hypothetical protein
MELLLHMTLVFTYSYGPENITVSSGRALWTFYFRQTPGVREALRRLAETDVPVGEMPGLWNMICLDMTTTVTEYGNVTFTRTSDGQSSTTSVSGGIVKAWCVEMLRIYDGARA